MVIVLVQVAVGLMGLPIGRDVWIVVPRRNDEMQYILLSLQCNVYLPVLSRDISFLSESSERAAHRNR